MQETVKPNGGHQPPQQSSIRTTPPDDITTPAEIAALRRKLEAVTKERDHWKLSCKYLTQDEDNKRDT